MKEIELIIKIPEEIRLALINNVQLSLDQESICDSCIIQAIINGTPQPKTGHWYKKYEYGNLYCSECNHEYLGLNRNPKFCEECGAKMEVKE